jgi:hypothetical protein
MQRHLVGLLTSGEVFDLGLGMGTNHNFSADRCSFFIESVCCALFVVGCETQQAAAGEILAQIAIMSGSYKAPIVGDHEGGHCEV